MLREEVDWKTPHLVSSIYHNFMIHKSAANDPVVRWKIPRSNKAKPC